MNKPKFRAWDDHEKVMLENVTPLFDKYGSMIAVITDFQLVGSPGTSEIEIGSFDTILNWDDFPYILMQYTGLKDKNGVEIYEGDICEWHIPDMGRPEPDAMIRYVSVVEYRKGSFNLSGYLLPNVRLIKVLGSIHENPELLSGVE